MGLWDTNPADWTPTQFVEPSDMRTEVRDRFLATLHLQKGFGFSVGQGNAASGGQTQLTNFDVTIPANLLNQPGSGLIVEGLFTLANNTNSKASALQVASGTLRTIFSTASAVSGHAVPFRILIRRRTSTTGIYTGIAWINAANAGNATSRMTNATLITVDWTISQVLKIFASSSGANDLVLNDYHVGVFKGDGALV